MKSVHWSSIIAGLGIFQNTSSTVGYYKVCHEHNEMTDYLTSSKLIMEILDFSLTNCHCKTIKTVAE